MTVTAKVNGNAVSQRVALRVEGLPTWAKGTFNGVVGAVTAGVVVLVRGAGVLGGTGRLLATGSLLGAGDLCGGPGFGGFVHWMTSEVWLYFDILIIAFNYLKIITFFFIEFYR